MPKKQHTLNSFTPGWGLRNKHIQTLYSTFFRKQNPPHIEKEKFELEDGDFVECFWHNKPSTNSSKAIVILFHGLEGSFESPYILGLINKLSSYNISSVLMHFRGRSGEPNRLARSYHSGDTADAKAWIEYLKTTYPHSPLYGVGYSLGGNMILKLMGEWQKDALLEAAVAVSAPMQLDVCADRMDKGFSKLYQAHLLQSLNTSLINKAKHYSRDELLGLDEKKIKKLKSFWQFDDAYTAPIHGFDSADDYYAKASSKQYLKDIQKDTLIIHALDDPFMTPKVLPLEHEISKYIHLEIYPYGGHVGFISGSLFKPYYWLDERISYFIRNHISKRF